MVHSTGLGTGLGTGLSTGLGTGLSTGLGTGLGTGLSTALATKSNQTDARPHKQHHPEKKENSINRIKYLSVNKPNVHVSYI